MTDDDLWRVFREVSGMPYGAGQISALEQLIRRVDGSGDEHLAFATRMVGTTAYVYGGEPAKAFVTFSWCLAEYDREPRPYHAQHTHNLLWHFKYMINAMLKFPEIPLDRTTAALEDMRRRYQDGGHSPQAVYKHQYLVANHVGAAEEADEWYRRWLTTPRDDLSDCAGCDPSTQVSYLSERGRDEEAVALAEPVVGGRLTCSEQPQTILTALLRPYLRTDRREAAANAHREAYRRMRDRLSDLWDVADHVRFCTWSGNPARGLEIVERHLGWLDRPPSPAAAMHFAASSAAALRYAATQGGDGLTVRRPAYGDRPAADLSALELAEELVGTASGIAARFDARNGTSRQSDLVTARLAAEPLGEHVPLSASLRRAVRPHRAAPATSSTVAGAPDGLSGPASPPGSAPGSAGGPGSASGQASPPGSSSGSVGAAVPVPADATADELLDLAEQAWNEHEPVRMEAVLAAYDQRFTGADLPPATIAHRLELRGAQLAAARDVAGALETNLAAMRAYEEAGQPVRAQILAGRVGELRCLTEDTDDGLAMARAAAEFLAEHGDPRDRARGLHRLATVLNRRQHFAEALATIDRMDLDGVADPYLAARADVQRLHLLEQLDRLEDFQVAAGPAYQRCLALGVPELTASAGLAYVRSLTDPAQAVAVCDDLLPVAPAEAAVAVRVARGRALRQADRLAEAIDDLAEAVALNVEQGRDGGAFLRWELADAYRGAGRLSEAAEVAEEAVTELDGLGFVADADGCRHMLAGIYERLGETDAALALLDQLADSLDGPDNLPGRAQVLEEAGGILYDGDRDALAAQRFEAAGRAYRLADMPVDELRARRRQALALVWAGDVPAAVRVLGDLDALAAAQDGPAEPHVVYELAMVAETAARVLAADGRGQEALDRIDAVPGTLRSIGAFGEAAQVEMFGGELRLRLGRPAEAEPVLRSVLGGLPARSDAARRAAWLLAAALDNLGRPDEAGALRNEYGIDEQ